MERIIEERQAYRKLRVRLERIRDIYQSPKEPTFYDVMHALDYASLRSDLAKITGDKELSDRWDSAIHKTCQSEDASLDLLRTKILEEAEHIESTDKDGSTETANAFRNLAESLSEEILG